MFKYLITYVVVVKYVPQCNIKVFTFVYKQIYIVLYVLWVTKN